MASITSTSTSTAALSTRSGNATLRRDSGLLEQNVALESRIECEITSTFLGRDQVNVNVLSRVARPYSEMFYRKHSGLRHEEYRPQSRWGAFTRYLEIADDRYVIRHVDIYEDGSCASL